MTRLTVRREERISLHVTPQGERVRIPYHAFVYETRQRIYSVECFPTLTTFIDTGKYVAPTRTHLAIMRQVQEQTK